MHDPSRAALNTQGSVGNLIEALGHLITLNKCTWEEPCPETLAMHHLQDISRHLGLSSSSHAHCCPLSLMEQLAWDLPLMSLPSPESSFPIDISAVKKDHSFLDQDSLKSLCR